jgi:rhodanese-related sulfurtransferase
MRKSAKTRPVESRPAKTRPAESRPRENHPVRPLFRQIIVLLVLAAIPALVSAYIHRDLFQTPPPANDETTWEQIAAWRRATPPEHILLVDARPDAAYATAHAPGALPLNEAHWEEQLPAIIAALRDGTRIVVYCDDTLCDASRAVATRLRRELALPGILVLKGGWRSR